MLTTVSSIVLFIYFYYYTNCKLELFCFIFYINPLYIVDIVDLGLEGFVCRPLKRLIKFSILKSLELLFWLPLLLRHSIIFYNLIFILKLIYFSFFVFWFSLWTSWIYFIILWFWLFYKIILECLTSLLYFYFIFKDLSFYFCFYVILFFN